MNARWTTSNKAIFNISYHLIWCTKYRRKLLTDEIESRLKILLIGKAEDMGLSIVTMEIMPDHVHLFVKASPVDSPHYIVQQLKGMTSRTLRQEFPGIKKKVPTLWTRSYYCESIGHISSETVQRYIEGQKNQ
jgi:putative transposase